MPTSKDRSYEGGLSSTRAMAEVYRQNQDASRR
jgi:hypothetical protein